MLTRDQMLERSRSSRAPEAVQLKSWPGETVFLRGMTGAERNSLLVAAKDETKSTDKTYVVDQGKYSHELIARCLCDAEGKRLFRDEEAHLVGEFPGNILDELLPIAQRLSGLEGEGEAEKN